MVVILGYIAAIFIGITLGLIGGGGSILTVPVLVYLLGASPTMATGYSLFIVGVTSAIGSVAFFKRKLVSIRTAVVFGIPSIIAVYATRAFIVPALPDIIFSLGSFNFTKDVFLMVLFAVLMILASYSMIKKKKAPEIEAPETAQSFNYPVILLEGAVVGVLTGLVGAGGGFLIIPALVILSKLPMKMAVGTSLVIIAAKSMLGFLGEPNLTDPTFEWNMILLVTAMSIAGIFLGSYLSTKIDGAKLKPAFGWFVLVMGIYILAVELFFA
jgi:uncharacterized membrane protein YfcA